MGNVLLKREPGAKCLAPRAHWFSGFGIFEARECEKCLGGPEIIVAHRKVKTTIPRARVTLCKRIKKKSGVDFLVHGGSGQYVKIEP